MSDWYKDSPIVGTVLVEVGIPQQWMDDVLCTAFDGGVGGCWLWAESISMNPKEGKLRDSVEYKYEVVSRGGELYVDEQEEHEDGKGTRWILTSYKFIEGLQQYLTKYEVSIHALLEDHDANDADNIVQFALFGEVVYG